MFGRIDGARGQGLPVAGGKSWYFLFLPLKLTLETTDPPTAPADALNFLKKLVFEQLDFTDT